MSTSGAREVLTAKCAALLSATVVARHYELNSALDLILFLAPFLGVALIVIAVWVYVLYYVYKDSRRRGMNTTLWLLLIWFTGILGLIIYLVARRKHPVRHV